jgi:HSP20 family molecular chaperone IbpA
MHHPDAVSPAPLRRHDPALLHLRDEADAFVVFLAVPGVHPEDLDVRLCDGVLTICHLGPVPPDDGTRYRTVYLPHPVEAHRVTAVLAAGVLTVTAPKTPAETLVHVPVVGY